VPFVVFQVERILERADVRDAEERDRAVAELRPVLASVPASVLREDLVRRVAGRLELSEERVTALITNGRVPRVAAGGAPSRPDPVVIDTGVRAERTFLVLCIALPDAGRTALAAIDPDQLLTSAPLRRAARHLVGQTELSLSDVPADDEELVQVMADLTARAERVSEVSQERLSEERLEHARLVLELARVDRAIRRARTERGGDVGELAREREGVLAGIREVVARLENPV
jgi:DNA primase